MDDGERVLWRGRPHPGRTMRRWLVDTVVTVAFGAIGLVVFVMAASGSPGVFPFLQLVVAGLVLFWLIWLPVKALGAWRRATRTSYELTDRRLVVDGPSGRTDVRLANLPELQVHAKGDGYGVISFVPRAGAGPERYVARLQRFTGSVDAAELMGPIPDARRVYQLIRDAQTGAPSTTASPADWARQARIPLPDPDAPVARLSFTESGAAVPLWFSLVFVVVGAGMMVLAVVVGLDGSGIGVLGIGAVFATIGGVLARGRLRDRAVRRRLAERGLRVEGRVADIAATGMKANRTEEWVVRYTYQVRGSTYTGHGPPAPWAAVAKWAAGDAIQLLVDPDDPSESVIAPPGA